LLLVIVVGDVEVIVDDIVIAVGDVVIVINDQHTFHLCPLSLLISSLFVGTSSIGPHFGKTKR